LTKAVCYHCGEFKKGAFTGCGSCKSAPNDDEEIVLSLALTDHYFDVATLSKFADAIKNGKKVDLTEAFRAELLETHEEFKSTILGKYFARSREARIDKSAKKGKRGWWPF